jgi:hypothetical protein
MAEKSLFETPFLDVKRKDLKPWLAHYQGQYFRLFRNWYVHRYFVSGQPGTWHPVVHAIIIALGVGYWNSNNKARHDAIFWDSGTKWDYSHGVH